MKLRTCALLLLGACSATSFASFEMMLMLTDGRIHRYDPENNVALGSFGAGQLGTYNNAYLAINPTGNSQVDVLNGDGVIRKFNYSTGAYVGSVALGSGTLYSNLPLKMRVMSNGNYLVDAYPATGQVSRLYSSTGTLLATMNPFGVNYVPLDSTVGADGNIYTLNRIQSGANYGYYTFVFNSGGTYVGFNSLGSSTNSSHFTVVGTAANEILVSGSNGYNTWHGALGTGQTYTQASWSYWGPSDGVVWIVEGHSRTYVMDYSYSSPTYTNRLAYYDPASGIIYQNQYAPTPYTTFIQGVAIVNAPEPGVWAAMGLGLVGLMRRRRTRA